MKDNLQNFLDFKRSRALDHANEREKKRETIAKQALQDFDALKNKYHGSDDELNARMQNIMQQMTHYRKDLASYMPTYIVKAGLLLPNFKQSLALTNTERKHIKKLCQSQKIVPSFDSMYKQHYLSYTGTKLVAYIALSMYNMNNTPGSLCVEIDTAVSIDTTHRMSNAINAIKKNLRRRKHKCVLFTQPANTQVARKFWQGRLAQSSRASMMNGLIALFDSTHKIYVDASDMASFFE